MEHSQALDPGRSSLGMTSDSNSASPGSNPAPPASLTWCFRWSERGPEGRRKTPGAARDVGKGLVDRNPLDAGREIFDHLDGRITQPLVVLEMAADKDEVRTELARLLSRHASVCMEDCGCLFHPDRSSKAFRGGSRPLEHNEKSCG